ncbi:hypothetical protein [Kordia antarctica]|nr:hypothetical protein [Kordia antarctica]
MKQRYTNLIFVLITFLFLQNCTSKKATIIDSSKPSILFQFEGNKPLFFKALEADIRKYFSKEGILVGFEYNFKVPPRDNNDYKNLPKYVYETTFDLRWNINFIEVENLRFNLREREKNSIYKFILNLYNSKTDKRIEKSFESLSISYIKDDRSYDLAKKLLKKYKKILK